VRLWASCFPARVTIGSAMANIGCAPYAYVIFQSVNTDLVLMEPSKSHDIISCSMISCGAPHVFRVVSGGKSGDCDYTAGKLPRGW